MTTTSTANPTNERILFVTVGTTSFDPLIRIVSSSTFLQLAKDLGYTTILVQYGKGEYIPFQDEPAQNKTNNCGIHCEAYRFKPSLQEDVQSASLILSHAGAGSIMEALAAHKKMIVVINNSLMHNHQWEVAHALAQRGYLKYVDSPNGLLEEDGRMVREVSSKKYTPLTYPKGDVYAFSNLLDDLMGYSD